MKSLRDARSQWRAADKYPNQQEFIWNTNYGVEFGSDQEHVNQWPLESMRRSAARLMGRVR